MTIIECISRIDLIKPNTYSQEEKVRWLSVIDGLVKQGIIDRHERSEKIIFNGYDENTPLDTKLIVPAPYDELYLYGLAARIDYWNGENDKYNDNMAMYNSTYIDFAKHYTLCHRPITGRRFLF